MDIRAAEISAILKSQIANFGVEADVSDVGSVLSVDTPKTEEKKQPHDVEISDANKRLSIKNLPAPVLSSLRWPGRPDLPDGNLAWTYMLNTPTGGFALFVGQVGNNGGSFPFEVWVNGAEQPRGLGAIAKTLSMDMRSEDRAWLKMKLESLAKARDEQGFPLAMELDQYLTPDGALILCGWHGAVFEPLTGECTGGPCAGGRLTPWPVEARGGIIRTA